MCGDRPYHRREIEALILELCGREARGEETSKYEKELEEGRCVRARTACLAHSLCCRKSLDEVRQEISETSEVRRGRSEGVGREVGETQGGQRARREAGEDGEEGEEKRGGRRAVRKRRRRK
eukprot:760579-Hanusia_phi.AAC.1